MNVHWLQEEFITIKCKTTIDQYWRENGAETLVANQWEASKATMRGVFTTETRGFSKALNSAVKDADVKAIDGEREYIHDRSPSKHHFWQDQIWQYKLLLTEYTEKKKNCTRADLFSNSGTKVSAC